MNQLVATRLLQHDGCEVTLAANGREAVEAIAASPGFDLVLMDCHMPVMDGFEATRQIRSFGTPAAGVRIVALTASVLEADRQRCLAAGMDGVLAKPILPGALAQVVRDAHCRHAGDDAA